MRLVAVIFDNDATAAYDRMIPSQCMITSRRAGVPESAIQMKLTVLHRMKYFIKTANGKANEHLEYALHQMAATKPNTLSTSRKPSHFDPDY
jgi:hypothetical protein